ncbi:MAG: SynChlorMet cassette radical SAM/SPASM protein ScmE [Desulfomonile tiedjei]|uniref:SynChlorMet cassette radical SAM/SPASM protein ScmE n=1 Tax=Desulfomonile tiedjei TaxID=2358 RepID=A0A9D6V0N9_9BACT|nr:SynChlorMet cassette radical SAM/SPASM protein ScmE [Desulfomonile tiedjei]
MKVMRTPRSLDLAITSHCNLRCAYCSHFSSAGDVGSDLSTEEWLQFFEELKRCGVMDVCLQGGEPFFRPDFKELISGIIRNRMRFSILSNGTLITEEMAAFLASSGRCDSVQVSIDGSIPTTHDAFRGEGNFIRALRGLKLLREQRVNASVRVTIHRRNVNELEEIARFLLEELEMPGFSTNSASYFGLCRKNTEQVQLTAEERSLAMEKLLKLTDKYHDRISAQAGPLAEARGWRDMEAALKSGELRSQGGGFLTGCGGPITKLAVRADGTMLPCIQLPEIELGVINRDSLKEIWQNNPELYRFRLRRKIPLSDFEFCRNCDYLNYCTGNCPAAASAILQDPWHPSPDACYKRFKESGGRLPKVRE